MTRDSFIPRYSPVAMAFHWIVATLILLDFGLAESFSRFDPGDLLYFTWAYPAHMSIGMIIIILGFGRIGWRLTHSYPGLPPDMKPLTRIVARTAHVLLYVYALAAPVSGWVVLSVRRKPPALIGALHWPNISFLAELSRAQRTVIHDIALPAHVLLSFIGMGLVACHVAAALCHHYWWRDDVLRRMVPQLTGSSIPDAERV